MLINDSSFKTCNADLTLVRGHMYACKAPTQFRKQLFQHLEAHETPSQGIGRSPGLKIDKVLIHSHVAFHKVSTIW